MVEQDIPWLKNKISDRDLQRIQEAVRKSEQYHSGEIVPMIVRRSMFIGHVPVIIALSFVLLGLLVNRLELSSWDFAWLRFLEWFFYLAALPMGFWFARNDFCQRIFTSNADEQLSVERRAMAEFALHNVHQTKGRTGILLLLSLAEHRAVVIADNAINEKVGADTWNQVIALVIAGARRGHIADGFIAGIEKCGEILRAHFPDEAHNPDEISNKLIVKL